jgi:precorrin-6B methylase 2
MPYHHTGRRRAARVCPLAAAALTVGLLSGPVLAQAPATPATPQFGQPGKDVVWVPSPDETVALMLDLARVTPDDVVIDLGSGDGRTVIAAAQRGARALGIEYDTDLVALSRAEAVRAGVADRARFVEGDMYEADVSQATVLALFLLTENLRKLTPTFLALRPGTRIVSNTFTIPDWTADAKATRDDPCTAWCTVLLYVVPAQVAGTWRTPDGEVRLVQQATAVEGTSTTGGTPTPLVEAALRADRLAFAVNGVRYDVRVEGDTMIGTATPVGGDAMPWRATRLSR